MSATSSSPAARCARCAAEANVGVLCAGCAREVAPCAGLLREHVVSRPADASDAWLVDGFGVAHPVAAAGCRIGRGTDGDLALLHGSVSRDHAELARGRDGAWQARDRGSRNGTRVDGRRVDGRGALAPGALLGVGEVRLWFLDGALTLATTRRGSDSTHGTALDDQRFVLTRDGSELCVLVGGAGGGAVLHRAASATAWVEVNLSPLELQLLRTLCRQAATVAVTGRDEVGARSRACVATKQLARVLPFQSEYADEENVRQVVRRLRTALAAAGLRDVVEGVQGRGYFVGWDLTAD